MYRGDLHGVCVKHLSQVTYADFAVFTVLDALKTRLPEICDHFPNLKIMCDSVSSLPAIQKWLESRPQTPF